MVKVTDEVERTLIPPVRVNGTNSSEVDSYFVVSIAKDGVSSSPPCWAAAARICRQSCHPHSHRSSFENFPENSPGKTAVCCVSTFATGSNCKDVIVLVAVPSTTTVRS